jgi:hypothetical protein
MPKEPEGSGAIAAVCHRFDAQEPGLGGTATVSRVSLPWGGVGLRGGGSRARAGLVRRSAQSSGPARGTRFGNPQPREARVPSVPRRYRPGLPERRQRHPHRPRPVREVPTRQVGYRLPLAAVLRWRRRRKPPNADVPAYRQNSSRPLPVRPAGVQHAAVAEVGGDPRPRRPLRRRLNGGLGSFDRVRLSAHANNPQANARQTGIVNIPLPTSVEAATRRDRVPARAATAAKPQRPLAFARHVRYTQPTLRIPRSRRAEEARGLQRRGPYARIEIGMRRLPTRATSRGSGAPDA